MASGPYTGPLTGSKFETTKRSEAKFRDLLTGRASEVEVALS
jgi:hypothetical protein